MIVHEWNVRAFIFYLNLFHSFFHLSLFPAKCRMQMLCPNYADEIPWSVLPMWYANIVPLHAIDRLLTTDLDVNFLWMPTKCYASPNFSFSMQMIFTRMQMRNIHMMHMSPFRDAIFMMQMSHTMVQMQRLSMMVPTHV